MKFITIEQIYQDILDGKRKRFPPFTWNEDINFELSKRVTKYLIEHVLLWDRDAIRKGWNQRLIIKMKLSTVLSRYNSSPYAMLNDAYPNFIKEWELGMAPLNFWTKENALKALRWTIEEKEHLTDEHLYLVYGEKWIKKHKLSAPCGIYWNGSPYAYLNELYPNRFKEWQLSVVPKGFWTKQKALEILQWTIEEKEQLTDKQLLNVFDKSWLKKYRLSSPCKIYWANSPYAMLNALYPNRFKEWQLKKAPMNFWTKENSLEALKWTIEVKEKLSETDIKNSYGIDWLNQQNLRTPIIKFWNGSPYAYLNSLYPERFKEWELLLSPNNYWTKKKALEALQWTIEVKEQITEEELLKIYTHKWLNQNGLKTPLRKYWNSSPYAMLNDLYPNLFSTKMLKRYRLKKRV
ncbi:TPA: hypothetical protein QCY38_005064 [Bacillus toyonensis]|uniref:hypothetical protein n=1 Tax=Bacillus cereus group sp. BceL062 TaxID=3445166 RepID=UPI003847FB5A|nr:hypothetical protein [Bacillus toyonensis]